MKRRNLLKAVAVATISPFTLQTCRNPESALNPRAHSSAPGRIESPLTECRGPAASKTLVFAEEFDGPLEIPNKWGWKTHAYEFGDRNPNAYKRDWLTLDSMTVAESVLTITATRRDDFYWYTGLLTTGDSADSGGNGFTVRAGDFLVNRVNLPVGNMGAWPALWTWLNGDTEVDVFEWHSDNPNLLEFSNHIRGGAHYHTDADLVAPGQWVWIGTELGETSNTWYVGRNEDTMQPIYSDATGIGNAQPHLIVNLSVGASQWHASPTGDSPITYEVDCVRVYR